MDYHRFASAKYFAVVAIPQSKPEDPPTSPNNSKIKLYLKVSDPQQGPANPQKAADVIKIGIMPAAYPRKLMSSEQQMKIEEVLARLVFESRQNPPLRFRGIILRCGFLVVNCVDKNTADWLNSKTKDLCLENLEIKMVSSFHTVSGVFPKTIQYSVDEIRNFISYQNPSIPCQSWKGLTRIENIMKNSVVVFLIDEKSFKILQGGNFLIEFGLSVVKLDYKDLLLSCLRGCQSGDLHPKLRATAPK